MLKYSYLHSLVIFIAPCIIKREHTVLFHAACSDHITRLSPRLNQISMNTEREKERKKKQMTLESPMLGRSSNPTTLKHEERMTGLLQRLVRRL